MTRRNLAQRLARIETMQQPATADQPATLPEAVDAALYGLRGGLITYSAGQWRAGVDYLGDVAAWLNDAAQPGTVLVAMFPREFEAALDAFDAGRLKLSETNYVNYHWLNRDARTGTPRLDSASYQDVDAMRLSSVVQSAVYHVHCQTAAPMPMTLEDFDQWLRQWQPYALPADLELLP